jgi:hypothetical protein
MSGRQHGESMAMRLRGLADRLPAIAEDYALLRHQIACADILGAEWDHELHRKAESIAELFRTLNAAISCAESLHAEQGNAQ